MLDAGCVLCSSGSCDNRFDQQAPRAEKGSGRPVGQADPCTLPDPGQGSSVPKSETLGKISRASKDCCVAERFLYV